MVYVLMIVTTKQSMDTAEVLGVLIQSIARWSGQYFGYRITAHAKNAQAIRKTVVLVCAIAYLVRQRLHDEVIYI